MKKVAIIWDIDGTLLSTGGAGVIPFENAVSDVVGHSINLDRRLNSGLTDFNIAQRLLDEAQFENSDLTLVETILHKYVLSLQNALLIQPAKPLGNIVEVLNACSQHEEILSFVGTGNFGPGAEAKLSSANLARFFRPNYIYSSSVIAPERHQILLNARNAIPDGFIGIVVGDSPHDVVASRRVGLRVICTPTGQHTYEELAENEPDALLSLNWKFPDLMTCVEEVLKQ